ncbi:hypothetical protein K438DRAFT_1787395 [Mycena galopus ATCC 62051]|nr:hypothetical protein K438DRAFT_1787395 [Mycena galopus ATCC 62051]
MKKACRRGTHKTLQHNDVFELNPNIQSRPVLIKFSSLQQHKGADPAVKTLGDQFPRYHARIPLSSGLCISSASLNSTSHSAASLSPSQYWCPLYRRVLDAINTPTPTHRDKGTTYNYALLMLICAVFKAQINMQHLWYSRRASTRLHVELIAAVYDKALKRKDFSGGVSKDAEDVTHKPNAHKRTQLQTKAEKKSAARREEHADDPKAGADTRKIGNLMAGDQTRVNNAYSIYGAPMEIIVGTGFLYSLLGWSASAGFVVLLINWPLNSYVSQR